VRDSDKIKNSIIDEYYNEAHRKHAKNSVYDEDDLEFKSKLNAATVKMNVLNDHILDFDIDTLSIIEKGEYIRENSKNRKEFILFVLISTIILSLCAIAILKMGPRIFIISQIIIVTITPWIIIPVIAIKKRGSEV